MGWMIPLMVAGGMMGGLGGGKAAKQQGKPTRYQETTTHTPFDWDPGTPGNQGTDLIRMLAQSYMGLLGRGLGPSRTSLGLMGTGLQDFYRNRGGVPQQIRRDQRRQMRRAPK